MASDYLDDCDVIWETPSIDSSGSMPLGNGDIGLNLWAEPDGDILFFLSKIDAWDEHCRTIKLARIRLSLSPNPFRAGLPFRQRLRLREGAITVRAGEIKAGVDLRIWVDANRPVVRVEIKSARPIELTATAELWRTHRTLQGREAGSAVGHGTSAGPILITPDTRLPRLHDRLRWFHRNETSVWMDTMRHQSLEDWAGGDVDPLLYHTAGAAMEGDGLRAIDNATLKSAEPQARHLISVHPLAMRAVESSDWEKALAKQIEQTNRVPIASARAEHAAWWDDFWNRSYINVTGDAGAAAVTRGYAWQRFMVACAGRGAQPFKFNGSIFNVDAREPDEQFDADYRRWGSCYWFQNTRLAYWPLLAAGDFEQMRPLFQMYLNALPMALHRTRKYFDHPGAFFPETMYFWGAYLDHDYGHDRANRAIGEAESHWIRYYYSGAIELLSMLLEHELYVFTDTFARTTLLPLADGIITFFDRHYPRVEGKVRFTPAAALETWQEAVDPLPEIAGLRYVLAGLLRLPAELTGTSRREMWQRFADELPPIPMRNGGANTPANYLIPAVQYDDMQNFENPELYAVFPYKVYGVGKTALEIARRTFERREYKVNGCWRQDSIHAALLGLADDAKRMVADSFSTSHRGSRFPGFWGPGFDWIPDMDHGGAASLALQLMLLQCEPERILILPAWPKGWDVEWKLHAPMRTVVEGVVRGGELRKLTITPTVREKDVVLAKSE